MFNIITRFSLVSKKMASSWRAGRTSFTEYKKNILDHDRLMSRFIFFKNICIPSLEQHIGMHYIKLNLLTSTLLPEWLKHELEILRSKEWINVHYFSPDDDINLDIFSQETCKDMIYEHSMNNTQNNIH